MTEANDEKPLKTPEFQVHDEIIVGCLALAEPTRVVLMQALAKTTDPVHVTLLATTLGLGQGVVSHHLKILYNAGLVEKSGYGRYVMYRTSNKQVSELLTLLATLRRPLDAEEKVKLQGIVGNDNVK